ncbi:hypothetical protein [Dyella telluris]|uniref:Uncharacterized protein n=1 Tax=Dyella telluris TaxID=2763498 RepID=A0A7G8Q4K5_9GAMM|nr:hypothetical protein [Dyella telluris]QNK01713.1 hypothetical protein H8F01_00590 [Dyella telluris]
MHHHAMFIGSSVRSPATPIWIQPAEHTYRPRKGEYPWVIVEINMTTQRIGEVVEKYVPPRK